MANSYFQFKQFRIDQDACAMKVCTDSCLFGALAPVENPGRILDVGTGTGLLALMAAQRCQAQIEAVEIDAAAAKQARENALNSPWSNRIQIFETSLQQFRPAKPYDVILCNPPFFLASLRSMAENEQVAKHATSLSFSDIAAFAAANLAPAGKLCILLPEYEQQLFAEAAKARQLFPVSRIRIRHKTGGKVIRVVATYSFSGKKMHDQDLFIREANGTYSAEFRHLLKEFYLAL